MFSVESLTSKIYYIRDHKVMLDRDLAELYGVETKVLKQAVRRNEKRFPEDFMFVLSNQEVRNLTSQTVISSWGGRSHPPLAFAEQGVAMLSSVLRSKSVQTCWAVSTSKDALRSSNVLRCKKRPACSAVHRSKNVRVCSSVRRSTHRPPRSRHPAEQARQDGHSPTPAASRPPSPCWSRRRKESSCRVGR